MIIEIAHRHFWAQIPARTSKKFSFRSRQGGSLDSRIPQYSGQQRQENSALGFNCTGFAQAGTELWVTLKQTLKRRCVVQSGYYSHDPKKAASPGELAEQTRRDEKRETVSIAGGSDVTPSPRTHSFRSAVILLPYFIYDIIMVITAQGPSEQSSSSYFLHRKSRYAWLPPFAVRPHCFTQLQLRSGVLSRTKENGILGKLPKMLPKNRSNDHLLIY